jgi:hypothetical protein
VATSVPASYDYATTATTNSCSGFQLSQLIQPGTFPDNKYLEKVLDICWT